MRRINISVALMLFSWLTFVSAQGNNESYVQEACGVTRYQNVCVQSLSPFSNKARRSPSRWARVGVSVTIREVKGLVAFLNDLKQQGRVIGRNRGALSDCCEVIQDALDDLHRSLRVLRMLNVGEFEYQMSDLLTWLSTALTDEDTCLDGFDGHRGGRQITVIQNKVQNASYLTSNALALANWLATSGVESLGS
ncbi:hypothetical protein Ancab_019559 [Ancistrocladus abbreviatus]